MRLCYVINCPARGLVSFNSPERKSKRERKSKSGDSFFNLESSSRGLKAFFYTLSNAALCEGACGLRATVANRVHTHSFVAHQPLISLPPLRYDSAATQKATSLSHVL